MCECTDLACYLQRVYMIDSPPAEGCLRKTWRAWQGGYLWKGVLARRRFTLL